PRFGDHVDLTPEQFARGLRLLAFGPGGRVIRQAAILPLRDSWASASLHRRRRLLPFLESGLRRKSRDNRTFRCPWCRDRARKLNIATRGQNAANLRAISPRLSAIRHSTEIAPKLSGRTAPQLVVHRSIPRFCRTEANHRQCGFSLPAWHPRFAGRP